MEMFPRIPRTLPESVIDTVSKAPSVVSWSGVNWAVAQDAVADAVIEEARAAEDCKRGYTGGGRLADIVNRSGRKPGDRVIGDNGGGAVCVTLVVDSESSAAGRVSHMDSGIDIGDRRRRIAGVIADIDGVAAGTGDDCEGLFARDGAVVIGAVDVVSVIGLAALEEDAALGAAGGLLELDAGAVDRVVGGQVIEVDGIRMGNRVGRFGAEAIVDGGGVAGFAVAVEQEKVPRLLAGEAGVPMTNCWPGPSGLMVTVEAALA